jgi:hypothetical protein
MRELALVASRWPLRICGHSNRLSAAPLELVDLLRSSRGDRREDLYPQITVCTGPSTKAFALISKGFNPVSLGELERPLYL